VVKKSAKSRIDPSLASRVLRTVPAQGAFRFFTDIGQYTGECSLSLTDFLEKIDEISLKSLEFHFKRRDFERWISQTLGDKYLTGRIRLIKRTVKGEALRNTIQRIVKTRVDELKFALFWRTSSTLIKKS
jgi:hypothetical protein